MAAATGDVESIVLLDNDTDGKIDRFQISVDNPDNETWALNGITPYGFTVTFAGQPVDITGASSNNNTADPLIYTFNLDEADVEVDTSVANLEVVYTQAGGDGACVNCFHGDTVELSNIGAGDAGVAAELDGANPVVISVTPADETTNVSRTSPVITITFSEEMDGGDFEEGTEFDIDGDADVVDSWTEEWSEGNLTVTLTGSDSYSCSSRNHTVILDEDEIDADTGQNLADEAYTWSFTTRVCSSDTSSGGSSSNTSSEEILGITAPTTGTELTVGTTETITWSTLSNDGAYANLLYVLDGITTTIASNVPNTHTYNWVVPANLAQKSVKIRVEVTDLATVIAHAETGNLTVRSAVTPDTSTDEDEPGETPVTVISFPTGVHAGDFIRSASFPTVYYVDANGTRRPFYNSTLFYTWAADFSVVKTVTDETLRALPLGFPMLPKPGVVLVKIESVPHVYAVTMVDGKVTLRWISSEAIAHTLYGDRWSDYVIDLPVTLFSRFVIGADINDAPSFPVDRSLLRTRTQLSR